MKAVVTRYLNDIVSLTTLALMSVALVAGQSDTAAQAAVAALESQRSVPPAQSQVEFRLELGELPQLNLDQESLEVVREILSTRLERRD